MKKHSRKLVAMLLLLSLTLCFIINTAAEDTLEISTALPNVEENCTSAILMEASTGKILYEHNAYEPLPPASVTKVMTLLLVMEAIENGKIKYTDMVSASANACSMGGSQIYLKEGELMSVEDLLKSVVIASANDAAVALAEYVAGSEENFVSQMNDKAKDLGMLNTNFENTNGLDDTAVNHVCSAHDIAIMSRELIKHEKILEFSSTWMDTVRDGEFGLTNTNRLVRFYKGANGLKTGSTSKAGFCITATAERYGMTLICVIMNSPSRDIRNKTATTLLDHGFSNYQLYNASGNTIEKIEIKGSNQRSFSATYAPFSTICEKGYANDITSQIVLNDNICAPIKKGDTVGYIIYKSKEKEIGKVDIVSEETLKKINIWQLFLNILSKIAIS